MLIEQLPGSIYDAIDLFQPEIQPNDGSNHYMEKAVCNENCKHGLGRDFLLLLKRADNPLHPMSSGFKSRATQSTRI